MCSEVDSNLVAEDQAARQHTELKFLILHVWAVLGSVHTYAKISS